MPLNDALAATGAAGIIYAENGTKHKTMTNSSKADLMTGGGVSGGSGGGSGSVSGGLIGGGGVSLASLQGQKWSQVFDMDKMIKQLRTAEKSYLRGGGGKATGSDQAKLHVQRLNAADMAYYDIVPKLATRDLVVCNTCNGSYTKAGFQNHIALQHPAIWEATSNKVNPLTATGDTSQQETAAAGGDSLAGGSPTETLSASTMSSCSNGSSSSTSQHTAANATSSSSSSSSSRHKSSSSSSKSSSSSSKGSSGTSSRSRSKSSKNRHHSSPAPAPELKEKTGGGGGSSKKSSSSSAIAAPPAAATAAGGGGGGAVAASIKEEFVPAPITVFSSSSNSSCSLPPNELVGGVGLNYSPANHQQGVAAVGVGDEKPPELQPKKKPKVSSDHRTKASKDKPVGQVGGSQYEQQQQQQQVGLMSELDQAVSSITGQVESEEAQPIAEEELPLPNTSDENSISLTLDEMLDSKLINEILKNFDESALDTAQQQQQQQPNGASQHASQASKRLRYDDVAGEMGEEYIYQQQTQQQQPNQQQQQVYGEDNQSQLTTIDAMQLQQLIYQQQQMLEQAEQQQQQHKQELPEELQGSAANVQQQQQFSVYNVQSLTDDAEVQQQQQQEQQQVQVQQQQLDEHMILPSIIYEITDTNPVSVLEQQKVIAEFLTQAGYENVDVNVLQAATGGGTAAAGTTTPMGVGVGDVSQFNDDLNDFDFTKLETVSDKTTTTTTPTTTTKTVKLEATNSQRARTAIITTTANIHIKQRSLVHAKCHEESYFNVMHYSGQPRPLAMNTFGLVKLPNGLGATLRKNLLTTRKANNTLLSLNGGTLGVVGQLARPPPPAPQANNYAALSNGTGMLVKNAAAAAGKTIYAQKSSVIAQDRLRCNKRALVSPRLEAGKGNGNGLMTVKRLNELLLGKAVKKEKPMDNEEPEQQQQKEELEQQQQQQLDHKLTHSFYEKRRKLLAKSQQQQQSPKRQPQQQQQQPQYLQQQQQQQQQQEQVLRQRSPNFSLPLQNNSNAGQNSQPLLKKQLLRTLSDSSSNILAIAANNSGNSNSNTPNANSNPWKSQSSTPGGGSTPSSSDLMRVFV